MDRRPTTTSSQEASSSFLQWASTTTPAGVLTGSGSVTPGDFPSQMPSRSGEPPAYQRSLDSYQLHSVPASPMLSSSREGGFQYSTHLQLNTPGALVPGYSLKPPPSQGLSILKRKCPQESEKAPKKNRVEENDLDSKFNGYYLQLPFKLRQGVNKRTIWHSIPLVIRGFVGSIRKADVYDKLSYTEKEDVQKALEKLKTVYSTSTRTGELPSFVMKEKTVSQDNRSGQSGASGGSAKPKESRAEVKSRVQHLLSNLYSAQAPVFVRSFHPPPSSTAQTTGLTERSQQELLVTSHQDSGYSASFSVPHDSPVGTPLSQKTCSYPSPQPELSPVSYPMSAPACVSPAHPMTPQLPYSMVGSSFMPESTGYYQPCTPSVLPGSMGLGDEVVRDVFLPPFITKVQPKSVTPAKTEAPPSTPHYCRPKKPIPAFGNRPYSDDSSDEEDAPLVKPVQEESQPLTASFKEVAQKTVKKSESDRGDTVINIPMYKIVGEERTSSRYMQLELAFPELPNRYKNLCFINSGVQLLKATLPQKDKNKLISYWQKSGKQQPENVVEAFSCLLERMEYQPKNKVAIHAASKGLIQLCRKDERFQSVIQLVVEASSKGLVKVEDGPKGIDLIALAQNDSHGFLQALSNALSEHLNIPPIFWEQNCLQAKSGEDTFLWPKGGKTPSSVLVIQLQKDKTLQDSINQYFEPKGSEYKDYVQWPRGSYKTTKGIHKHFEGGMFPVEMNTQVTVDLKTLQDFRLCISGFTAYRASREEYKSFLKDSFKNIKLTVFDKNKPDEQCEVEAIPVCIIAFEGSSPGSGHYLCLVKNEQQWVIVEDSNYPVATSQPEIRLRQNNMAPYVIHYRVVERR